jgi:hypothetical protein
MVMANLYMIPVISPGLVYIAKLTVDVDVDAERFIVYDATSYELITVFNCESIKVFNVLFEESYAIGDKLNIAIVDTHLQYNGAVLTGVSCELVDANIAL